MTDQPRRLRLLKIAVLLALVFNLMALPVLVRATPILFALFMFLAQPLFAAALVLLLGGAWVELRARRFL
jgi:hypothetical protein